MELSANKRRHVVSNRFCCCCYIFLFHFDFPLDFICCLICVIYERIVCCGREVCVFFFFCYKNIEAFVYREICVLRCIASVLVCFFFLFNVFSLFRLGFKYICSSFHLIWGYQIAPQPITQLFESKRVEVCENERVSD